MGTIFSTIYSKAGLNDTAKLMYLQDVLKDGLARFIFQELIQMSDSYKEAIKCLKQRYYWPRLDQEEYICIIMDAVPIKNGSDNELRLLYDAVTQQY